ncbi:MAG: Beta-ketoacyl synthase [Flavipsychrobacter sp.]|nr:Beta-ketoacyl synthase [Flavipsychrobacter sp.]
MSSVYAIASNIISALGMDTAAHWHAVAEGLTGIKKYTDTSLSNAPFMAAKLDPAQLQAIQEQTKNAAPLSPFEQLAACSIQKTLNILDEPLDLKQTAFILSTTKGNIELLGKVPDERILLYYSAKKIADYSGIPGKTFVISHACVSGIVALQYAMRLIQAGRYKHVIVTGADRFSRFVLNGFQSFQAISDEPCRPFDAGRKGITLGEAAATIILSATKTEHVLGQLIGGATSNDANHISGPSRTGEELAMAIAAAIKEAGITPAQIDMISAHGTATPYNDEMESKAFDLAGLLRSPVHSFKGYIGHTLGAAGVLESAMVLESLRHQTLIPSAGFENLGVPKPITMSTQFTPAKIQYALKTASGFGGCNATAVWGKV